MMPLEYRQILERVEAAPHRDAGVVHHHVDAAEGLHGLGHQPLAVLLVGDVGGNGARFAAARAAFLRQRLEALAVARRQRQACAARGERQRQRAPDALGGTGQNDPACPSCMVLRLESATLARLTSYGGWHAINAWAGCCDDSSGSGCGRPCSRPRRRDVADGAARARVLRARARFDGRSRRAVQCHRARQGLPYPEKRSGSLPVEQRRSYFDVGRRRRFWDATHLAPPAAVPAGAGRGVARRFGARRAAGADRGVLGPRAAEGRLVAATAVRRELGADLARAQVLRGAGQRPQRHGGDGRAHHRCARCSMPRRRTTRRGA